MVIPDYQTVMFPLLKYAGDGKEHRIRDAVEQLADEFRLSEEERKECCQAASKLFLRTESDGLAHI